MLNKIAFKFEMLINFVCLEVIVSNKIYEDYYQIIEDNFGRYFEAEDPINAVNNLLKKPMTSRILYETSDSIINEIFELFQKNSAKIKNDILSLKGIKTHFCGNIAPQDAEKFLCQTGLYVDTTIISDPISYVQSFKPLFNNKNDFISLLFRHTFNMLKLKDAVINDSENPILSIVPKPIFMKQSTEEFEQSKNPTLDYFNYLFDEDTKTIEGLEQIISNIKSKDDLIKKVCEEELLIPEIREAKDLSIGFDLFYNKMISVSDYEIDSVSQALYLYTKGCFTDSLINSEFANHFNLISSFDSENSWHNYKFMIDNQTEKVNDRSLIINAFTLEKVKWIGNSKLADIIKARENSCLQDFREIINKEINYIDEDKNIHEVADQINYNLEIAFNNHQSDLKQIESDFNYTYSSNFASIIGGTISFINGLTTQNPITLVGGGISIAGSLISGKKSSKDYIYRKGSLVNSPMGVLFNVKGESNE